MLHTEGGEDELKPFQGQQHRWLFQYLGFHLAGFQEGQYPLLAQLTTKAIQFELVDSVNSFRILPVILNEVDVIGCSQQTSKSRRLGIP